MKVQDTSKQIINPKINYYIMKKLRESGIALNNSFTDINLCTFAEQYKRKVAFIVLETQNEFIEQEFNRFMKSYPYSVLDNSNKK